MKLLAVLILAGALAGTALAAPGDPQRKHTAADQALAKAALLKKSDFGTGWTATPTKQSSSSGLSCATFKPDQSDLIETGNADSPDFANGPAVFLSQTVAVFKTAGQAASSWSRIVKPGLIGCLASLLEQGSSKGTTITVTHKGTFAFPKLAARTAAFRLVASVKSGTTTLPVYADLVLLARGRMDSVIFFTSVGKALPAALEQQVAGIAAKRLK